MDTVQDVIDKIHEEAVWVDIKPYSHNLISIYLRILKEKFSLCDDEIADVMEEAGLDEKGWSSEAIRNRNRK